MGVGAVTKLKMSWRRVDSTLCFPIQDRLATAARELDMPRVWFDDAWGDRIWEDA
jgi:hypothetical protein